MPATRLAAAPADRADDSRTARDIRFSEAEWEEVRAAAERHHVPAADFVRVMILEIARDRESPGAVLATLVPLIERTFRCVWMLAAHRRDELLAAGRGEEISQLVDAAKELQGRLQAGRD